MDISSEEETRDTTLGSTRGSTRGSSELNTMGTSSRKGEGKAPDIPGMEVLSHLGVIHSQEPLADLSERYHTHLQQPKPMKTSKIGPSSGLGLGRMVQTEIDLRKKENLGLAPARGDRKLGGTNTKKWGPGSVTAGGDNREGNVREHLSGGSWSCLACTLFVKLHFTSRRDRALRISIFVLSLETTMRPISRVRPVLHHAGLYTG
jgi:hypothetical protein